MDHLHFVLADTFVDNTNQALMTVFKFIRELCKWSPAKRSDLVVGHFVWNGV